MRKNKQISSSLLLVLGVLVMTSVVSATAPMNASNVTMVTPAASGIMSGSAAVFNCSIDQLAAYQAENYTRVRVYFQSASLTGNTTETTASAWVENSTAYDFNGTIDTTVVEDGNDYTFKCQLWNGTKYINQSRSSITIDNTEPQAATSLSPTSDTDGSVTFSGTVVGVNTTSCTLRTDGKGLPGGQGQAMTHSGDTCSLTISNVPESIYTWYIRASDESNTTDSSKQQINVDIQTSAGKAALLAQQANVQSRGGALLTITDLPGQITSSVPGGFTTIIVVVIIITVIVVIRRR